MCDALQAPEVFEEGNIRGRRLINSVPRKKQQHKNVIDEHGESSSSKSLVQRFFLIFIFILIFIFLAAHRGCAQSPKKVTTIGKVRIA